VARPNGRAAGGDHPGARGELDGVAGLVRGERGGQPRARALQVALCTPFFDHDAGAAAISCSPNSIGKPWNTILTVIEPRIARVLHMSAHAARKGKQMTETTCCRPTL
jgi:hypothetical protein